MPTQNLSRALLKKLKEYAKTRELTIQLPISSGNDTPALYKRLGFKDMGNRKKQN